MTTMDMLANVSSGRTVLNDAEMSDLAQAAAVELARRDAELAALTKERDELEDVRKEAVEIILARNKAIDQRDAELAELRKVVNLKTEALISVIAEIEGGDGITVASQYLKDASQAWVKGGEKV